MILNFILRAPQSTGFIDRCKIYMFTGCHLNIKNCRWLVIWTSLVQWKPGVSLTSTRVWISLVRGISTSQRNLHYISTDLHYSCWDRKVSLQGGELWCPGTAGRGRQQHWLMDMEQIHALLREKPNSPKTLFVMLLCWAETARHSCPNQPGDIKKKKRGCLLRDA